jgi:hypothetical protein
VAEKFVLPFRHELPEELWNEERLIDADGETIFIRFKGKPSLERYQFIRDYFDLKIQRMRAGSGFNPA